MRRSGAERDQGGGGLQLEHPAPPRTRAGREPSIENPPPHTCKFLSAHHI